MTELVKLPTLVKMWSFILRRLQDFLKRRMCQSVLMIERRATMKEKKFNDKYDSSGSIMIACWSCHAVQPFQGQGFCLECKEPMTVAQIEKQYEPLNDWVN